MLRMIWLVIVEEFVCGEGSLLLIISLVSLCGVILFGSTVCMVVLCWIMVILLVILSILLSLCEMKMMVSFLVLSFWSVLKSLLIFCGMRIVVGLLRMSVWVLW